jgi:nucleoid-associated protein YgaU
MIFAESRYETASVLPIADNAGVYHATVIPTRVVLPADDYTVHRVADGDRLDALAFIAYGDAEFWWKIADANPEVWFPDDITPGMLLRIPRLAVDL